MLRDAMSFSNRTDKVIRSMETMIDELSWGFELHETFSLKQGVTFKLSNAGHILGSCFILFAFPGDGTHDFRVIFSGDLGCTDTPIIPDPDPPDACDLLVLESTYGDRNHTGREDRVTALKKLLKRALEDKGIVLWDIRLKVHRAGPSWKVKPHPEQASTLLPAIPPTQTRTP